METAGNEGLFELKGSLSALGTDRATRSWAARSAVGRFEGYIHRWMVAAYAN